MGDAVDFHRRCCSSGNNCTDTLVASIHVFHHTSYLRRSHAYKIIRHTQRTSEMGECSSWRQEQVLSVFHIVSSCIRNVPWNKRPIDWCIFAVILLYIHADSFVRLFLE